MPNQHPEEEYVPDVGFDGEDLQLLIEWTMPFGRYRGRALIDLPEEYLFWFERHGFPDGDLGRLMSLALGIRRHGAEEVVRELRLRMQVGTTTSAKQQVARRDVAESTSDRRRRAPERGHPR